MRDELCKLDPELLIERIARRVVELLHDSQPEPAALLSAEQVAARLGVGRAWVYRHAAELGAVRIGAGRRPRVRFDAQLVCELASSSTTSTSSPPPPRSRRRHRTDAELTASGNPMLPIPSSRAYD